MASRRSLPCMFLVATMLAACGGSDSGGPAPTTPCTNLLIDTRLSPVPLVKIDSWNVTYGVAATPGATVSSIQYRDATGALQTVNSPALPFSYPMTALPMGTQVTLSAVATAPGSKVGIVIEMVGISSSGNVSISAGPVTCSQ